MLFSDMGLTFSSQVVDETFRLGALKAGLCRPVIVKFRMMKYKVLAFKSVDKLKDQVKWNKVWLSDDLTQEQRIHNSELRAVYNLAKADGRTDVKVSGSTLIIGSRRYRYSDIYKLPHNLSLGRAKMVRKGDNLGYHSPHVFLSNMYPSKMSIDDVEFTSVEQGFQYHKARFMKDNTLANRILHTDDPYVCLRLGGSLPDTNTWNYLMLLAGCSTRLVVTPIRT